jgi:hypothetical protein
MPMNAAAPTVEQQEWVDAGDALNDADCNGQSRRLVDARSCLRWEVDHFVREVIFGYMLNRLSREWPQSLCRHRVLRSPSEPTSGATPQEVDRRNDPPMCSVQPPEIA